MRGKASLVRHKIRRDRYKEKTDRKTENKEPLKMEIFPEG